jgi:predicted transcriptional regulator
VRPETPVSAVAQVDAWHTCNWLPVVDHRNRVLGAVSRDKVFRAVGSHTGSASGRGDILLDLLADLVYLCDAALLKAFSRSDST